MKLWFVNILGLKSLKLRLKPAQLLAAVAVVPLHKKRLNFHWLLSKLTNKWSIACWRPKHELGSVRNWYLNSDSRWPLTLVRESVNHVVVSWSHLRELKFAIVLSLWYLFNLPRWSYCNSIFYICILTVLSTPQFILRDIQSFIHSYQTKRNDSAFCFHFVGAVNVRVRLD